MSQPWTVDGVTFLPGERPGQAVRLPALAVLDSGLTRLRYPLPVPDGYESGAGVVRVTLDLGAASQDAQLAEVGLPPEVTEVVSAVVGPSVVRLMFADRELAVVRPAGGHRPAVVVGAAVGAMEATLLHECAGRGVSGPLAVTVTGTLPATHGGGTAHVDLDTRPGGADGGPDGGLDGDRGGGCTAGAVAEWAAEAVEVDGDVDQRVAAAIVAAHLYRPAPSAGAWSLVPGWPVGPHSADAPLLPVGTPSRRLRIEKDAPLPWFAATPVTIAGDGLRDVELPGSRVRGLTVILGGGHRSGTVELDLGGVHRTLELGQEEVLVRYLPGPDGDGFRWRHPGGQWHTSGGSVFVVVPPE